MLDLENIVIAVGILFLSCLQAEIGVFPVWEAATLDFSLPVKSYNTPSSFTGWMGPKNIKLVCEVSFLFAYELR